MRRVWVVDLPDGLAELPRGAQVMIETYDGSDPLIAFRRDRWAVWGPPRASRPGEME